MIVGASSRTSASTSLRKPLASAVGMARLEDAAIDAAAEMLDEGAEQPRVGRADGEIAVAGVTSTLRIALHSWRRSGSARSRRRLAGVVGRQHGRS